jgi:hypothetical protein
MGEKDVLNKNKIMDNVRNYKTYNNVHSLQIFGPRYDYISNRSTCESVRIINKFHCLLYKIIITVLNIHLKDCK